MDLKQSRNTKEASNYSIFSNSQRHFEVTTVQPISWAQNESKDPSIYPSASTIHFIR